MVLGKVVYVLSPVLFNIYMNFLLSSLSLMLDICYTQGVEVDIIFNAQKSALFVVGKAHDVLIDPLWIGHHQVSWHRISILNIWESSLSQVEFCGLTMILLSENFMLLLMLFVVM